MSRRAQEADGATVQVRMLKTSTGSEDGIHVQRYQEGESYVMGEALAKSFIQSKRAKPAPGPKDGQGAQPASADEKHGKGPDENKAR